MSHPKTTESWTYLEWGNTYREKGQNNQAVAYYQIAHQSFRAEGCQAGLFKVCTELGHCCEIAGDLDEALQYFQEALMACSPDHFPCDLAEAKYTTVKWVDIVGRF